jgi:hypothetical protein
MAVKYNHIRCRCLSQINMKNDGLAQSCVVERQLLKSLFKMSVKNIKSFSRALSVNLWYCFDKSKIIFGFEKSHITTVAYIKIVVFLVNIVNMHNETSLVSKTISHKFVPLIDRPCFEYCLVATISHLC